METIIKAIINESSRHFFFLNQENISKNSYLSPSSSVFVNCAVPWCSSHEDFLKKGFFFIDRFHRHLQYCIWQDHETGPDDDFVRVGGTGWDPPAPKNRWFKAGGIWNMLIKDGAKADEEVTISLEQASS